MHKQKEIRPDIAAEYVANRAELGALVYAEGPGLSIFDVEAILEALVAELHRYRRPPGPGFIVWATARVKRQARRHQFLTYTYTEHTKLLFAAITRSMFGCFADDWAVEPCDLPPVRAHSVTD